MSKELVYDHFVRYFPHAPAALCVKECARLAALREFRLAGPILDVGCGDGLFAKVAFEGAEVWGIDIDAKEGRWAQASRAYSQIVLGDITKARLPSGFFASCVANCSLEHVPDLQAALSNIAGSLMPGAEAILFVPNKIWASKFMSVRAARAAFGDRVAQMLQDGIDEFFAHRHLHDEQGWREQIAKSPLELAEIRPVLSTSTTVAFEALLLPSLAGYLNKKLTSRWTNFPGARQAVAPIVYAFVKSVLAAAGDDEMTAEYLIVCRRPERHG
ncbi:MAG: class I SAM-dependent methyltransferase [Deltaproteobacteria bacterium]|nr:class I SAM-dependent methyltransferase [Deltaproteobacteria bacterium]